MGLLSGLLTLPLAPVRGVAWLAEEVYELARQQAGDPALVREQLEAVEAAYQAGELSSEEAEALQEQLLERLLGREGGPTWGEG